MTGAFHDWRYAASCRARSVEFELEPTLLKSGVLETGLTMCSFQSKAISKSNSQRGYDGFVPISTSVNRPLEQIRTRLIVMPFKDKQQCSVSIAQWLTVPPRFGCRSWIFVFVVFRELQSDYLSIAAAIDRSFEAYCFQRPISVIHSLIRLASRRLFIHIYGKLRKNEARNRQAGQLP